MTIILVQLLLLSIIIGLFYLIAKGFKEWSGELNYYAEMEKNRVAEQEESIIGEPIPTFEAVSLNGEPFVYPANKEFVMVFMDSGCIYCNNNLEEFLSEIQHKGVDANVFIFMEDSQKEYGEELADLYNGSLKIYTTERQTFSKFDIQFLPAFVLIDQNLTIKNITPIPMLVFKEAIPA